MRTQPRSLNLGILAHVDAGKTTLTERLLHLAGVIDEPGSVDSGTTQTDTLALERRRGITIKSAVVGLILGETAVNLVDTPGHPDFIAEVERVLGVLDGAVLVLSAVEGVQPQTRILMRALRRLGVPTLLFVNKIDRVGADLDAVLRSIRTRLTADVLPMGTAAGLGSRAATFTSYRPDDEAFRERETVALAEHDDSLLAAYVDGRTRTPEQLLAEASAQTRAGVLHPVFAGSAATGAGVPELMLGISALLPTSVTSVSGEPSGRVFKVERGVAGEKIAYVRMFTGSVGARQRLLLPGGRVGKVAGVELFEAGRWVRTSQAGAGQIARLQGLAAVRVGDDLGVARTVLDHHFAPPTLEASVSAARPEQGPALRAALASLADQDPLIDARSDDDGQVVVSLYGRVQQEVLAATLAEQHGVEAVFSDASVVHVERPRRVGRALERYNTSSNPHHATLGLRIAPGLPGSGLRFDLEVVGTQMPLFLYRSPEGFASVMQRHVAHTLAHGLFGWEVTDCRVTVTEIGYTLADGPPSKRGPMPTAHDFRRLVPLVVRQALTRAGVRVCEPILLVTLEIPTDSANGVQRVVTRWGAELLDQRSAGDLTRIGVRMPAARLHELQRQLPDLTGGEGVLESGFDSYAPVSGRPPVRRGYAVKG
ncbi:MAG TPA: translation factor GTPase family protein [Nocardioides sp.]|uniref:translation factor GTPase family protein n=1 Tax=Nocardioides sp. TaxID=35761 RepID=UPI002E3581E8|nr:translation factor GTPase family protein [Nocardioides sp.]HEX3930059.1 translation factor GTPase family protein [Nocardioides sp.]